MEVIWPLDRDDYLTVCDNHPTPYVSWSEMIACHGERDEAVPFNSSRLSDYARVASSPALLRWVTLTELAAEMGCSQKEIASLAHHLASAVEKGLLERRQMLKAIGRIRRLRWSYRKMVQS